MWLDARRVPRDTVVEADVCIVGGGPAGLTVARELAGTGARVCLLESGGREYDDATQSLADGKFSGASHFEPLRNCRRRQLGGMGNQWDSDLGVRGVLGFRAGPLDPVDFERRDWLPYSGWPFGRAHLDPYYERAHATFGLGPFRYDAEHWGDDRARPLPVAPETFTTDVWTFVRQDVFTKELPEALGRSGNVSVYLWANVVEIETDENAANVTALRAACLDGNAFRVSARIFVLAAGGMENARLLLLSDRVQRGGLGNGHNVVGRFFTEHQPIHGGTLYPTERSLLDRLALYDVRQVRGVPVIGKLTLREEVARREQLLGFSVALLPKHPRYRKARQEYVDSFATLVRAAARGRVAKDAGAHLRNVIEGWDYVAARALHKASGGRLFDGFDAGPDMLTGGGWSAAGDASRKFSVIDVHLHVEQAPHPENRVMLAADRDALGCRRTHLHWLWRERDIDSVRRGQRLLADGFRRAGIGEYHVAEENGRPVLDASGLHHHMGTTRMHADPKQGVVDADSRVHGTSNLYVAGYSVFPTGGYINPTLTVMAMCIRLGDHLKRVLAGPTRAARPAAATAGATTA
jgi:choline dehydrogenase-like flavoprotein